MTHLPYIAASYGLALLVLVGFGLGARLRLRARTGAASKRPASPALRAGEAVVLSQVNPELVV